MFIEPGIFLQASKIGVKGLTDLNGDGCIDSKDLNMARANIQDPVVAGAVKPAVKQAIKEEVMKA